MIAIKTRALSAWPFVSLDRKAGLVPKEWHRCQPQWGKPACFSILHTSCSSGLHVVWKRTDYLEMRSCFCKILPKKSKVLLIHSHASVGVLTVKARAFRAEGPCRVEAILALIFSCICWDSLGGNWGNVSHLLIFRGKFFISSSTSTCYSQPLGWHWILGLQL